jgi:hypothetical protein
MKEQIKFHSRDLHRHNMAPPNYKITDEIKELITFPNQEGYYCPLCLQALDAEDTCYSKDHKFEFLRGWNFIFIDLKVDGRTKYEVILDFQNRLNENGDTILSSPELNSKIKLDYILNIKEFKTISAFMEKLETYFMFA